ncbi:hypothetical protein OSB04_018399 [Centaurea solstitialis]|uniref:F-box domain-containing protein n=1 Tax=Centaurea solstitialis TaxID=347529 RepID=A0AA38T4S3_9ASTR|nr:hypothetical protein OSB04_018399 [Centaurea solstitialis]
MASSQQPTSMENLPHDILLYILIRLPAKQLGQMRCVSKPWDFLLSQPSFVKSHLHRSTNLNDEIFLVLSDGNYDEDTFSITPHDFSRSPRLDFPGFIKLPAIPFSARNKVIFFGSVNGLISFGFPSHHGDDFVVKIWNPSLSAVLTVPSSDYKQHFDCLHFRFGYDPKTDDYKIVKLMSSSGIWCRLVINMHEYDFFTVGRSFIRNAEDLVEGEVYSMKKGSWKLITNRLSSHVTMFSDEETVCVDGHDGHLHWLGYVEGRQMIVSFDLGLESFGEISLPDSVNVYWNGLGIYGGKLCVTSFSRFDHYEVWVMNEYGVTDSWVKMNVFSDSSGEMGPYGFTSTNKFLFRSLSDCPDFDNPGVEKVESFMIRDGGDPDEIKIVRYVDSLVWVAPAKHGAC